MKKVPGSGPATAGPEKGWLDVVSLLCTERARGRSGGLMLAVRELKGSDRVAGIPQAVVCEVVGEPRGGPGRSKLWDQEPSS